MSNNNQPLTAEEIAKTIYNREFYHADKNKIVPLLTKELKEYAAQHTASLLARVEELTNWIHVTDRLPANNVKVLVFAQGTIRIDYRTKACKFPMSWMHTGYVTHWLPLIKPPRNLK